MKTKRKVGRPKGSKNKEGVKTGRPKGSIQGKEPVEIPFNCKLTKSESEKLNGVKELEGLSNRGKLVYLLNSFIGKKN